MASCKFRKYLTEWLNYFNTVFSVFTPSINQNKSVALIPSSSEYSAFHHVISETVLQERAQKWDTPEKNWDFIRHYKLQRWRGRGLNSTNKRYAFHSMINKTENTFLFYNFIHSETVRWCCHEYNGYRSVAMSKIRNEKLSVCDIEVVLMH